MIRELEEAVGAGVCGDLGDFLTEFVLIDKDWDAKRNETRAETKPH